MKALRFLTKRAFYINILIIIALIIIIIETTFFSLKGYTRHGEEIIVPDFVGLNADTILKLYQDDFNFVLLDSVYTQDLPEGAIYQQDPLPNSKVKKGRNMYFMKVSEAPERVIMPNLRNLSLRQAIVLLRSNGLTISELEYVDHFAKNAIVEQMIDNEIVEPGKEIVKGSAVKLCVGYGVDDKKTHLPNLLTVHKSNVKKLLNEASLNIGNEIYMDDTDDDNYRVFKMEPVYDKESLVTLGSKVDVWYKSTEKFDFDSYGRELFIKDSVLTVMKKKKLSEDTIKYVTDSFDYIITHRLFLFDSISREYDKNITLDIDFFEYIYRDDSLSIDSLYKIMESRTDTTYYYEN